MSFYPSRAQQVARNVVAGWCKFSTVPPTMPAASIQPQPYKGPSYDEVSSIRKTNLSPALFTYHQKAVLLNQGYRQWVWDHQGKRYLDMIAGIVTISVGHCHPKINEAVKEQMNKLWHATTVFLNPEIHEYARKLTSKLPGNLKVCYFTNSGGEANDLAILMSRLYTGSHEVISLRNGYHGMSPVTMGLTAMSTWKFNIPSNLGVHHAMNADPYKGPWGGKNCRDSPVQTTRSCSCQPGHCEASDQYVDQLEDVLVHSLSKTKVAAFIAEPIQGGGGIVQFPKNYLKRVYEHVRNRGGLCIADEVQTGFGRTGEHYWGFQGHGVMPDIVTMAKGIANGFPMAAVVTTPEVAQVLSQALHFNTYGGNPMACTIASTVLDIIDEEKLQQNCAVVGTHLLKRLGELRNKFEFVGDVRGKGLMMGLEFVTDKESRKPLPLSDVMAIWEDIKDMGVLTGKGGLYGNVLRVQPPMCIGKEDADFCVDVMNAAFTKYQQKQK